MNLTRHIHIAAIAFCATASTLFAANSPADSPPPPQTFEFQYQTSSSSFQPTYLWVTAYLNTVTPASTAILNYQVTTPEGVWTPTAFQPTSSPASAPPAWLNGSVEVTAPNGINTLTFLAPGTLAGPENQIIVDNVSVPTYEVTMTTSNLTDTTLVGGAPSGVGGSMGFWVPVPNSLTVPEFTSTLLLFLGMAGALVAFHRFQLKRANSAKL